MSLASVSSRAQQGIIALDVNVEVHLTAGLPAFSIVGLPEAAVRESKDRVRSALISANFEFPRKRITVNLAPADLPKEGGQYDLPIAIGILSAAGLIPQSALENIVFFGELALNGKLRMTRGALIIALSLRDQKIRLCLPEPCVSQTQIVPDVSLLPADHLIDVVSMLLGQSEPPNIKLIVWPPSTHRHDLRDVKGQTFAKRALTIAASGGHNILMAGPPGTGKSMLAKRFSGLLPDLSVNQALNSAAIASIGYEELDMGAWRRRPFQSPHHSASAVAMVGGGIKASPGEISLAHNGVLFLDEFPEFDRRVLENLREPMESGEVKIARAAYRVTYPADFILIAAMNPCNCGYYGDASQLSRCRCTPDQISRYRAKLSGPLLDRIDMHIDVPRVPQDVLTAPSPEDELSSEQIRQQVEAVQKAQIIRQGCLNSKLSPKQVDEYCVLDQPSQNLINSAMTKLGLSARGYHRVLKLSRSIADWDESKQILRIHLAQGIQFRSRDR